MSTRKVMIYSRFERLWLCTQTLLIVSLLFPGLAIHGLHPWISF